MEKLDRNLQRRVWARVYPKQTGMFIIQQRRQLQQCLQRSRENLRFYENMKQHGIYGQAFAHLAEQTQEHIKMLTQMLQ